MEKTGFVELKEIFRTLRGPEGCPWDKEQTHESLVKSLKEETRELIDAIKSGQHDHIKEELGDVLLHVMFHSQISSDEKQFDIEDVIDGLVKKLKRRHPHVFGTKKVKSSAQVILNWNRIKAEEKKKKPNR